MTRKIVKYILISWFVLSVVVIGYVSMINKPILSTSSRYCSMAFEGTECDDPISQVMMGYYYFPAAVVISSVIDGSLFHSMDVLSIAMIFLAVLSSLPGILGGFLLGKDIYKKAKAHDQN